MKKLYIPLAVLVSLLVALLLPAQPGGGPIFVPPVPTPGVFFQSNPSILLSNSAPSIRVYDTDAGANAKRSTIDFDGGGITWSTESDDGGSANLFFRLTRSGATPTLYEINPATLLGSTLEVTGSATLNDNLRFANADTGIILDQDTMMFVRSDNGEIILGSGGEPGFDLSTPNWGFNDGYFAGKQANQQIILHTNVIGQTFNVQTTGNTATTLAEIPLPSESAVTFTAKVTGAQSSYANVNGYGITATAKNDGGTSGLVVSQTKWHEKEDQAGWECIIDVDDTADSIRVRVTGAAATTINWSVTLDIVWVK